MTFNFVIDLRMSVRQFALRRPQVLVYYICKQN